ncbi:NAD(P)-dependent dehydrogenase (short-subunit alcohol dehydrogenase family) [Paenibacillus sp. 4624]|jgi:NAD(P)-dependent dehydrogenase (short-subunit alcohol dehydrogenase family)|uniref:SDR family NAD(P)-dependent oxidoreductase n=1 Tax=Paenibacillus sp. 4624 TaxID=3156453 RepID=UPI003D1B3736
MNNSKVALITGSATGLGRSVALKLASQGYNLALVDFNEQAGQETLLLAQEQDIQASLLKQMYLEKKM